jgi:hypothetical protein
MNLKIDYAQRDGHYRHVYTVIRLRSALAFRCSGWWHVTGCLG